MTETATGARPLEGEKIAITGKLASMTRPEAVGLIRARGGEVVSAPDHLTTILVVGQDGWPLRKDGRLTSRLRKARRLQNDQPITILTEMELLDRLGVDSPPSGRQGLSTAQLAEVLQVPGACIRAWVRSGLLQAHETVGAVHYFEFHQVRWAKSLRDFAKAGVSSRRISQSLRHLRQWLPNLESPTNMPAVLEQDRRLAVRLEDGSLADPTGQGLFDFSHGQEHAAVSFSREKVTPHDWFQLGCQREGAGEFEEAAQAYRAALLAGGPDATTCFNLANVLYALGRREPAVERYLQVVEMEPGFVEAWNNLGIVLDELEQHDEAVAALRQVVKLNPLYADAHYNLADILDRIGRSSEALTHWQAYLGHDCGSPWADYARTKAKAIGSRGS
jgi:tetratricopeptide (TPR) repeat protein